MRSMISSVSSVCGACTPRCSPTRENYPFCRRVRIPYGPFLSVLTTWIWLESVGQAPLPGTAIFPTSCSGAARRFSSIVSAGTPRRFAHTASGFADRDGLIPRNLDPLVWDVFGPLLPRPRRPSSEPESLMRRAPAARAVDPSDQRPERALRPRAGRTVRRRSGGAPREHPGATLPGDTTGWSSSR
jgi:hypothetical protein